MLKGTHKGEKSGIYKQCLTCHKEFYVYQCEINTKKYCSVKCKPAPNKGKKQNEEWVNKRVASSLGKTGHIAHNKGKKAGKILKCLTCGKEIYKAPSSISSHNFCSRDCSYKYNRGKNVYNYKDGKDSSSKNKWIRENSREFKAWRKIVLKRDGYSCKICGNKERLEVHHIIPFYKHPELVVLKMNGVTLCHNCHKETDSYGKYNFSTNAGNYGKSNTLMFTVPHRLQAYSTVGNYDYTDKGVLVIFVSEMDNNDYCYLIFLHEFIESYLCKKSKIEEKDITDFDIMFEKERDCGIWVKNEEPGNDSRCIYFHQHQIATKFEKQLCNELKIKWSDYEEVLTKI